jgi:antitoxin (DNA-binding transcriptional repressor) of toxin-antitoxin stability system
MIMVAATDFKANLTKYLLLAGNEDIHITKHGRVVATLSAPVGQSSWVDDLTGSIPGVNIDEPDDKIERLMQKYESLN